MSWFAVALWVGCLAPAATTSAAPDPSAPADERFEGRRYRVDLPPGKPAGVVVFLHGRSTNPWVVEREAMAALSELARRRGLIAVVPLAGRACSDERLHCWSLGEIAAEVSWLDGLVDHVEERAGAGPLERQIIGFSHGGFLLGGALERGLLGRWARVGVLAGGPVGPPRSEPLQPPPVFLQVGRDDHWQRPTMMRLHRRLLDRAAPGTVHFREVPGGHQLSAERVTGFLRWFWPAP
ncbi:MAG: hypothetical protein Q8O67_17880 [Deltaproteobacteria bacterium]|nr:hypothetical protein [Deltaproteobacteria bacterium]